MINYLQVLDGVWPGMKVGPHSWDVGGLQCSEAHPVPLRVFAILLLEMDTANWVPQLPISSTAYLAATMQVFTEHDQPHHGTSLD